MRFLIVVVVLVVAGCACAQNPDDGGSFTPQPPPEPSVNPPPATNPPVALQLDPIEVAEDADPIERELLTFATDVETPQEELEWSVSSAPDAGIASAAMITGTNAPIKNVLRVTFAENGNGETSMTLAVTDNEGLSDTVTFSIAVAAVEDAPVITTGPPPSGSVGEEWVYEPQAIDPEGAAVSFTWLETPPSAVVESSGRITWTPSVSGAGAFTLVASDGGMSATQSFTVSVT